MLRRNITFQVEREKRKGRNVRCPLSLPSNAHQIRASLYDIAHLRVNEV